MTIGRIMEYLGGLIKMAFTGKILVHFHKGLIGKVEKTESVDLK